MADLPPLSRQAAFSRPMGLLPQGDGDIVLTQRVQPSIATVMARSGATATLADRVRVLFDIALPDGPGACSAGRLTIIGTGPGTWLFVHDGGSPAWAEGLAEDIGGSGSVVDQSSAYALLQIGGRGARGLLGRGAFIDFHPAHFAAGSAAVTLIAHMGAVLWQRDDAPTYEIAVFRSYAESFWNWIETAAAGFGARLAHAQ